jgi:hypothetical protein
MASARGMGKNVFRVRGGLLEELEKKQRTATIWGLIKESRLDMIKLASALITGAILVLLLTNLQNQVALPLPGSNWFYRLRST